MEVYEKSLKQEDVLAFIVTTYVSIQERILYLDSMFNASDNVGGVLA